MRHFFHRQCSFLWVCLAALVAAPDALACRYNVRDLGFMDIGDPPYVLWGYFDASTSENTLRRFSDIAGKSFKDAPVEIEVSVLASKPDALDDPLLQQHSHLSLPVALFQSPDGQSLPIPLDLTDPAWEEALAQQLRSLVSSPARDAILAASARAFAVLLLFEGTDADATRDARRAIEGSIEDVTVSLPLMPKSIAHGPELVALNPASQRVERSLLWSFDLDPEPISEPRVTVIYGRARWMGPVAHGPEITRENLSRLLSIIGADCECGMDITWTRGTPLPVRWGRELYESVATSLGFDPENPMVKIEASRILNRFSRTSVAALNRQDLELTGFNSDSTARAPEAWPTIGGTSTDTNPPNGPRPTELSGEEFLIDRFRVRLMAVGGGLAAILVLASVFLVWQTLQRARR